MDFNILITWEDGESVILSSFANDLKTAIRRARTWAHNARSAAIKTITETNPPS